MGVLADDTPKTDDRSEGTGSFHALWRDFWLEPIDEHRNRLVEAYQYLVNEVVGRYAARLPRIVDRGDLTTAANVGLMAAISSFDPSRQVRFEAYGEMRIRGALLDELRTQDWLPRPYRQRVENQKRVRDRLCSELCRNPQDDEMAAALGLSPGDYGTTFGIALPGAPAGSMPHRSESPLAASGLDVVPDPRGVPSDEKLNRDELLRLVAQKLTEQEYRLVYLKYWEELPMREIGELMNLSESRVCKIHSKLIERLQDRFRVHYGEEEKNEGTKRGSVPS